MVVLGFVLIAELVSFTTIGASQNKKFQVGSLLIDTASPVPWAIGALALLLGGLWLRHESKGFQRVWDSTMEDIKRQAAADGGAT
jgi:branched-chain amino acid transport system permease protein